MQFIASVILLKIRNVCTSGLSDRRATSRSEKHMMPVIIRIRFGLRRKLFVFYRLLTSSVTLRPTASCTDDRATATTQIATRRTRRLARGLSGCATTR